METYDVNSIYPIMNQKALDKLRILTMELNEIEKKREEIIEKRNDLLHHIWMKDYEGEIVCMNQKFLNSISLKAAKEMERKVRENIRRGK